MTTLPISSDKKQQDIFDLERLADNELKNFSKLMTFDTASIQIIKDNQRYQIGALGFLKDNNPRLLRGIDHDNLIKPIVERKKITILSDTDDENNWSKEVTPEVDSWICAPLVVDDEIIGLLTIDNYDPTSYTYEECEKLVENFACDIAGRIKQWLSLYESKRRTEQLESLIAIGNQLTSDIKLNEDELFSLVEECAREALNIHNVTIMLINDADKIYAVKASRNGEIIDVYAEGWEPRNKNEGRGKVKYIINECKTLVLYAQYILDKKDEDYDEKVLFSEDDSKKRYKFSSIPNKEVDNEVPDCWIGVPIKRKNKVLGVISAFSWGHEYQLAAEHDSKVLEVLADKTAIALDNIRTYKKTEKLENVISFIKKITSKINLSESEILELIHEQASEFMDTDNMYIALYNESDDEVRFGLVFEKGKKVKRNPRSRKMGEEEGKTEYIIRTGKFLFHPTRKESEEWYIKNKKKPPWDNKKGALPPSPSWIGVPMLLGNKVLGVIASYHPEKEWLYSKGDVKPLQSIAESAAIALQNSDNYNKSEQWAFLGQVSASLAHRIANKGGLIRFYAKKLKKYLSEKEENNSLLEQIEIIDRSCKYLLELSDSIFVPIKAIQERLVDIDVSHYIDNAIKHACIPDDINIVAEYRNKKIPVAVGNNYLTEAFLEIIVNAIESMEENSSKEKKITIDVFTDNNMIKIIFSDTGKGIQQEEKNELFEFFSKKDDKKNQQGHKGFGLWWIKNFLEKYINGQVDIEPRLNGTDFIVFLPIKK